MSLLDCCDCFVYFQSLLTQCWHEMFLNTPLMDYTSSRRQVNGAFVCYSRHVVIMKPHKINESLKHPQKVTNERLTTSVAVNRCTCLKKAD